jgi:drug/metabolite transporter (DMT)-like permease
VLLGGLSLEGYLPPLAMIFATTGYAFSSILIKKIPHISSITGSAGLMIMANVSLIPFLIWQWSDINFALSLNSLLGITYLGIFPTGLAIILMVKLIHNNGATFMSLNNYLVPAFAVIWGILFLNESFSNDIILGFILILVGVGAASYRKKIKDIKPE